MGKKVKKDNDNDPEFVIEPVKPKSQNFNLLKAKKKKWQSKGKLAYFCHLCNAKLLSSKSLKEHRKKVHGNT
jgi:hypothetical protein